MDKKALELHQLATLKAGERAERAMALKVTDMNDPPRSIT